MSLLPHFIVPGNGSVLGQSLTLGAVQIAVSLTVNGSIVLAAGSIAGFMAGRPFWLVVQRWLMASVLAGLAVRMATEARK